MEFLPSWGLYSSERREKANRCIKISMVLMNDVKTNRTE